MGRSSLTISIETGAPHNMIPADIGTVLIIVMFMGLALLAIRHFVTILVRRATMRCRMSEPETYEDDGGRPRAPEIGSGLLVGDKARKTGD